MASKFHKEAISKIPQEKRDQMLDELRQISAEAETTKKRDMTVTAEMVNDLRLKTGAGIMACKKALQESEGDTEKAIDFLRKKGEKLNEQKVGRASKEGVVYGLTSDDSSGGAIAHISCETDFVAKNEEFIDFARNFAHDVLTNAHKKNSIEDASFMNRVADLVVKMGEKIKFEYYHWIGGNYVVAYNHPNYKMAVLVSFNKRTELGRDIAMQIAAMSPLAIDKNGISSDVLDREKAIIRDQILAEGKPENMVEKISAGKLQKFYKESTLLNQQFIKDSKKTVTEVLRESDKDLLIESFVRIDLDGSIAALAPNLGNAV